jgi:hypothetical protein
MQQGVVRGQQGSSEWGYAWIPFTASLAGGVVGAWIATAINYLNQSEIHGAFYEIAQTQRAAG